MQFQFYSLTKFNSMKKLFLMLIMALISAIAMAATPLVPEETKTFLQVLTDNWKIIGLSLIPVIEVVVRLTPTKKDDTFLSWLFKLFPNFRKGGGTHEK